MPNPGPYANPWGDYAKNLHPLAREAFDADPITGWDAFTSVAGEGQAGGLQRWLPGQFGQYRADWTRRLGTNPLLSWVDFLKDIDPVNGETGYAWMDPFLKGQRPSTFSPTMGMRRSN